MRIVRIFIVNEAMQISAPPQPHEDIDRRETAASPETPIASATLLRGQSVVTIAHRGMKYRLQETRAGKLILTK